jgi:polysaccharide export outer membrane protein
MPSSRPSGLKLKGKMRQLLTDLDFPLVNRRLAKEFVNIFPYRHAMQCRPSHAILGLLLAAALSCGIMPSFAQDAPERTAPLTVADNAPAPEPVPADVTGMDGYVLDTGDKIHVTVFGKDNENLGGDFEVDGTGLVRLPLIGAMRAGGLTARALEDSITRALAAGYLIDPRVNVAIATYRPFFILGEVNKPGSYPYVNNMNALNAVALAGGYTQRAVESSIYIRRRGETEERSYPADQRTEIHPGDIVRVPDTVFWRVMSLIVPLGVYRPY